MLVGIALVWGPNVVPFRAADGFAPFHAPASLVTAPAVTLLDDIELTDVPLTTVKIMPLVVVGLNARRTMEFSVPEENSAQASCAAGSGTDGTIYSAINELAAALNHAAIGMKHTSAARVTVEPTVGMRLVENAPASI
jgi:hypothetical protein